MPTSLSKDLRKLLEKTTADARVLAEAACRAALENLAVHEKTFRSHMSDEQKKLRNSLRARGRAVGDKRDERSKIQDIRHLTELAAYEHWHRLLFTRFLTENHLLITDEANGNVPVTLEECEELAPELGARDGLDLACRFARLTLPGVFRRGDPVLDLPIALNDQVELRKLLATLPPEAFRADDALGWTYQFWQAKRKDEVNDSGKKIGADELAPVTQLFTEDYMVEFLLHNTIGAWWAGKIGPIKADTEEEARAQTAFTTCNGVPAISWTYLRFVQNKTAKTWVPAAGTFEGWPNSAGLIRLLDPCMGSGHFLVFALPLLVRLRMEEEKLSAQAAVVAVLTENLHGLELDERCTQIAAFNVALTAWKLAGYQTLPNLNLACSGLAPNATKAEWMALAGENERARNGMAHLHCLFKNAPVLGSLINPRAQGGNLFVAEFQELAPLLTSALAQSENQKTKFESDALEFAVIAQGLAKAAEILAGKFTLVATNVPFLKNGYQEPDLSEWIDKNYKDGRANLATTFLMRSLEFCESSGSISIVIQQSWLYQKTQQHLRERILSSSDWNFVARLGPGAFDTISGEVVNVALISVSNAMPGNTPIFGIDAYKAKGTTDKGEWLRNGVVVEVDQKAQRKNPQATFAFPGTGESSILIGTLCALGKGSVTGDSPHFIRQFWEQPVTHDWKPWLNTPENSLYSGRHQVVFWQSDGYQVAQEKGSRIHGQNVWGKSGVLLGKTSFARGIYSGEMFDDNTGVLSPTTEGEILALLAFSESDEFVDAIRDVDQELKVTIGNFGKVSIDLKRWQEIAAEKYPEGLPMPHSDDPTQWLFNGHPAVSTQPLHVAVARLLGYQWPRQTGSSLPNSPSLGPDGLESFADKDGIVCLAPLNREQPAAHRLRQILASALGSFDERALISSAGFKGSKSKTLEDWLRDEFFEQHSKLFHDRPFIWHLWDGRADGFHALVNYHRLDHAALQKLAYSYLGDWIRQQDEDTKADKPGAAERLGAARPLQAKLAAILEGEAPCDIFVRWKPIKEQAQGWHPDLDDGIRQNIRPFLLAGDVGKRGAGLFRSVPLKLKDKDRGTEPHRPKSEYPWFWCEEEPCTDPKGGKDFVGTRWNNAHLTLAFKKGER